MPVPHYCSTCLATFPTLIFLTYHCVLFNHAPNPFYCVPCDISFSALKSLSEHMSAKHLFLITPVRALLPPDPLSMLDGRNDPEGKPKAKTRPVKVELQCPRCGKTFKSAQALYQHNNSLAHEERTMPCVILNCPCMFKSASGIAHHCESENAHPTISRHDVTRTVQKMDVNGTISINKQISGSADSDRQRSITANLIATEACFDGISYACFLCDKKLKTLAGLNSHLNSPAHDADEFRCPKCAREFKVISALAQHVEAVGCMKDEKVTRYLKGLTSHVQQHQESL